MCIFHSRLCLDVGINANFVCMKTTFDKFEGAGNDFVIIDNSAKNFEPTPELVKALCDRRFGIGADGLMLLEKDSVSQFRMRYFNSDGPEATMCGNGGRCISLFAYLSGIAGETMSFTAIDGSHTSTVLSTNGEKGIIELGMCDTSEIDEIAGGYFVNTGSPHWVGFAKDIDSLDIFTLGRNMRTLPEIVARGGANFNFVELGIGGTIKVRTYERGVEDETFACGTGAVASAAVTSFIKCPSCLSFNVHVRGGQLCVSLTRSGNIYRNVKLTGPARKVYSGNLETDNFAGK